MYFVYWTNFHDGTKLHEDGFALRVNFARVTFLYESKKIQEKKFNKKKNWPRVNVKGKSDS